MPDTSNIPQSDIADCLGIYIYIHIHIYIYRYLRPHIKTIILPSGESAWKSGVSRYAMDFAAWRVAVDCDWRVLDVAPKELYAEQEARLKGIPPNPKQKEA